MLINMAKEISDNSLNEIVGGMDPETRKQLLYLAGAFTLGVGVGGTGHAAYEKFNKPDADTIEAINGLLTTEYNNANSAAGDQAKKTFNKLFIAIQKKIPGVGGNLELFKL